MKASVIAAAVALLALAGTIAWVLLADDRPAHVESAPAEATRPAATPASAEAPPAQAAVAQRPAAAVPAKLPALNCAEPKGTVAMVDGIALAAPAFCADLAVRAGVLKPDSPPAVHQQARGLLDQWVDGQLVDKALAAEHAEVSPAELDAAMAAVRRDRPGAETGADGLQDKLRNQLRQRLALKKLVDLRGDLEVPPGAAEAEFQAHPQRWQQASVATIQAYVVRTTGSADPAEREAGEKAAQTFAQSVRDQDPAKLAASLEMRVQPPFELAAGSSEPELEAAVMALRPGEWTAPLHLRGGWAVARLVSRKDAPPRTFDSVQAEIRQNLQGQRRMAEQRRILAALRAQAKVEELMEL